jgi:hypothetical protein
MKYALLGLLAFALLAQSPKQKIESCGLGAKPACHCITRTSAIQLKAAEVCNGPHWRDDYKTQVECFRAKLSGLDHCSIAETWREDYDQESGTEERDGHTVTASNMGPMCSMACKKHDCKCDADGATCHFGHTIADHKGEK